MVYIFETEGEFRKSQQGKVAATYQPGAFLSFQENSFTDAADSVMTNTSYLTKPRITACIIGHQTELLEVNFSSLCSRAWGNRCGTGGLSKSAIGNRLTE